ncbi:carbohydrate ABC transporter permease [Devosia riboflavina]|uniref:carbohydrate ABC transporter permease n=1 Tax=Devosia riboflavina TaxID=46914 RepID=UPI00191C2058|nr:sugar ABC transporter permease [Devosia riboflavina]
MSNTLSGQKPRVIVSKKVAPYVLLLPFLLVFVGFLIVPMGYAFGLSLFKTALVGGTRFVGLENYARAVVDPKFWDGVWLLVRFGLIQMPIMLSLALIFALILDSGMVYARSFFRVSFFLPYAVPAVIATLLWGYLYGPSYGPVAQLATALSLPKPDFFSPGAILGSLANITIWEYTGYNMIIYFAALQAIPGDLEEAAKMDGASALTYALRVKLPMIVPMIVVTVIFSIIGTLQLFSEPYLITNLARSVINSNFTPNYYAYTLAFVAQQYNYSAAISFLLGAVVAVFSYAFMLLANRGGR